VTCGALECSEKDLTSTQSTLGFKISGMTVYVNGARCIYDKKAAADASEDVRSFLAAFVPQSTGVIPADVWRPVLETLQLLYLWASGEEWAQVNGCETSANVIASQEEGLEPANKIGLFQLGHMGTEDSCGILLRRLMSVPSKDEIEEMTNRTGVLQIVDDGRPSARASRKKRRYNCRWKLISASLLVVYEGCYLENRALKVKCALIDFAHCFIVPDVVDANLRDAIACLISHICDIST
jgi:hypothetical protein